MVGRHNGHPCPLLFPPAARRVSLPPPPTLPASSFTLRGAVLIEDTMFLRLARRDKNKIKLINSLTCNYTSFLFMLLTGAPKDRWR